MEARVTKLENALQGINITLATMTEQLKHLATSAEVEKVRTEVATLAAKLDGKANATDLRELVGRVGRIPTVPIMVGLFVLAGAVSAAWPWIRLNVFHLTG